MKLAFSTLGCPGWTWDDIFSTASDLGFDGIEIRGVGRELYAPAIKQFLPANIERTKARLAKAGMEIPILTSSAALEGGAKDAEETKAYIDLASQLGAPYVRVLCTARVEPGNTFDEDDFAAAYDALCEYGASQGVTPLIETSGELASSEAMAHLLTKVKSKNRGVLWDIHHPFRYFGETPEQTVGRLGTEIRYLHVKDSVMKDGALQYRMMGYGDLPVLDALRLLKKAGYDGYVALEWVKRWLPDLEEPGVVFAHYANYMSWLFKQL